MANKSMWVLVYVVYVLSILMAVLLFSDGETLLSALCAFFAPILLGGHCWAEGWIAGQKEVRGYYYGKHKGH